jgi:hypothetical protein
MLGTSTIPHTRRVRRRRTTWRMVVWSGLVTLLVTVTLASYRIGHSQGEVEIVLLTGDLAAQQELHRLTVLRLAEVEQQAEAAVARHAQLLRLQRSQAPSPELRRLAEVAAERLRAGVPVARLEFVLAQATVEPVCEREIESRRVLVHTPSSTGAIASATFFDNRVIVTGEGVAARTTDGSPSRAFDEAQPVTLRFLEIGGEVATVSGSLPLAHALALEGQELRFAVRTGERNPAELEVSAQRCQLP